MHKAKLQEPKNESESLRRPVTVIIPTYNRAHLIRRAVQSAVIQCTDADEIIVIDDGSADDTEGALAGFRDRIRYVKIDNGGAGRARNLGIRMAKNALIAFLDSDDEWMAGKLELQSRLMSRRPDILFSFSDVGVRYQNPEKEIRHYLSHRYGNSQIGEAMLGKGLSYSSIVLLPAGLTDFLVHVGDLYHEEMKNSHIATSTLMVQRDLADEALFFAEDLPIYEDWECFGRLGQKGLGAYLDIETVWLGQGHGHQLTHADWLCAATARIAVLSRVWGKDAQYLHRHGACYARVLNEQRLIRTKELLKQGRMQEAREEIQYLKDLPSSFRLLARLPSALACPAIRLRKLLCDTFWPS